MAQFVHVILLLALTCGPAVILAANTDDAPDAPAVAPVPLEPVQPEEPLIVIPTTTTVIPDTNTTTTEATTTTSSTTEKTTTSTTTERTTTSTERTTTTQATTTTTAGPPKPVGPPESNHWSVKNDTKFCLIVDMALQLNLTYKTTDGEMKNSLYNVPANTTIVNESSNCMSNKSKITVQWTNGKLEVDFALGDNQKDYNITALAIELNVMENDFPGAANQTIQVVIPEHVMTPRGMSYHCNRQQPLNATEIIDKDQDHVHMIPAYLSKVQWQAFHDRATDGYDLAKDCDAIDTPDIVPIAVGCALAGLVVIVLLGYLVGRRRSQNRGGYLSM